MNNMIHGQSVTLKTKTVTGQDAFGVDTFTYNAVTVNNVICQPASNEEAVQELQFTGKRVAFTLHIPKGDTNNWKDAVVVINGVSYKTYGDCMEYDPSMTPLNWNKQIKVERYE